jgi:peptidoglycan hydrolase-like protein with peptidoglycan-binding domain
MAGLTAERRARVKEPVARPTSGAGIRRDPAYVRWIQESLNRLVGAGLAVGGLLGPRTAAATRVFQARRGLAADGIVGPATERALVAAGAGSPPRPGAPPAPTAPFGPADVADPRIAPDARQSLVRMRGDPLAVRDAVGMLQAVKTRTRGGIYREDLPAVVALGRVLRRPPGQLVPTGEDAALVLAAPDCSRRGRRSAVVASQTAPARLDSADHGSFAGW